ncbi:MAG: hypothetical protein NZ697_07315 [Porticoccaceae bacterium]|nr:hypothetical protein [Porticoccaceae bacterium]
MKYARLLFIFALSIAGCASQPVAKMTPLEIQSLQTRQFEEQKDVVFPSVMSVFLDLGYTVESADKDTGFIRAQGAATTESASNLLLFLLDVDKELSSEVSQTAATAFIEEIGGSTQVRLTFVQSTKRYDSRSVDREDKPILDAQVYQNAFEKISNEVFVRSAK